MFLEGFVESSTKEAPARSSPLGSHFPGYGHSSPRKFAAILSPAMRSLFVVSAVREQNCCNCRLPISQREPMIPFFSYLREKAKEAVLAGVQEALDQIDPILANHESSLSPQGTPPTVPPAPFPQLAAVESKDGSSSSVPTRTPSSVPTQQSPAPGSGGLQERLAQATNTIATNNTAVTPPKPSSPKRGRGRTGEGGES